MDYMGGGGAGGAAPAQLVRQGSIYSLTLDELQSTLGGMGREFGSMNLDDLLKNIWTAEESFAMAGSGVAVAEYSAAPIQRQGSLTLSRTLSQKTVDEVWHDLSASAAVPPSSSTAAAADTQRESTFGEMTLEEFLVRAGVTPAGPPPSAAVGGRNNAGLLFDDTPSSGSDCGLTLGLNHADPSGGNMGNGTIGNAPAANLVMTPLGKARPFDAPILLGNVVEAGGAKRMRCGGGLVSFGDAGGMALRLVPAKVSPPPSEVVGEGNGRPESESPAACLFDGERRRRRVSGSEEEVMERTQRRMIKNRESAGRSCARKQAYTMELEAEVAKLREQIQEMQEKQIELIEMQKNQIADHHQGPKKQCLRRTLTGPW